MIRRRWHMVLAALCGLSLGIGIPLLGFTALPRTEDVDGYVVWVRPDRHVMLVYDTGAHDRWRGQDVLIHLPQRRHLTVAPGNQPVSVLRSGDRVHVQVSRRAHWAHAITLESGS